MRINLRRLAGKTAVLIRIQPGAVDPLWRYGQVNRKINRFRHSSLPFFGLCLPFAWRRKAQKLKPISFQNRPAHRAGIHGEEAIIALARLTRAGKEQRRVIAMTAISWQRRSTPQAGKL